MKKNELMQLKALLVKLKTQGYLRRPENRMTHDELVDNIDYLYKSQVEKEFFERDKKKQEMEKTFKQYEEKIKALQQERQELLNKYAKL